MPDESPIPTPLIIPNTVEVVMHAQRSGNERCNVIHYGYTGAPPVESELDTLCQEVETTIIEEQEDHTSQGTHWYKVVAYDLGDPAGAFHERSVTRLGIGGSDVNSWQTAFCLSKRSGRRGRSAHGRYYNFDIPKDNIGEDELNLTIYPSIGDQAARMLEPRVGGRFLPVVASRKLLTTQRFTSVTWDSKMDSQDRRSKARGN